MASAVARAYNGGLEAEPPAGVQGAEPPVGVKGRSPLKLKPFQPCGRPTDATNLYLLQYFWCVAGLNNKL